MSEVSAPPILEARGLTKRYEDQHLALDHVSFTVRPGEVYALLGANGAGKTTTINLFLNLIEPTEGEARILGHVCHLEPLIAKQYAAFVSENVMLYGNFTALQNLDYFARLGGRSDLTNEDYAEALVRVGLDRAAHRRRLREFSKGMRQKCGIAIAILKNAPAILLDEPTSGLDPKAGFEFLRLIESLRDEGKAIFMSTHDIFRAREIADTIAIMNRGRIVYEEAAERIAVQNIERLYIDFLDGQGAMSDGE